MKVMQFNVNAVVGTNVVAHGRGDTLAEALADFRAKQTENAQEYDDLARQATRSIEAVA